jgi:hypothetical protein
VTEPGLGQLAHPIPASVRPPFHDHEDISTLSYCGCCHSEKGRAIYPRGRPQGREVGPGEN